MDIIKSINQAYRFSWGGFGKDSKLLYKTMKITYHSHGFPQLVARETGVLLHLVQQIEERRARHLGEKEKRLLFLGSPLGLGKSKRVENKASMQKVKV